MVENWLFGGRFPVGITVIGRIIRGDLSRLFGLQVIQAERPTRLIHDGRLVARPARVGKPDLLALLVGKRLGVRNHEGLGIEIGKVQSTPGNLALESLLVLETDLGLVHRQAQTIQVPAFRQVTFDLLENRLALGLGSHEEIAPALLGMSVIDQNPPIRQASVGPSVRSLAGKGNFLPGLSSDLPNHDVVSPTLRVFSVPDRSVFAVPGPSLVEVGLRGIGDLMKTRTVCIDDADRSFPHADLRVILDAPEKNQFVSRLGPGRLEIPMSGGERLALGLTEDGDVDFPVLEVSRPVPRGDRWLRSFRKWVGLA